MLQNLSTGTCISITLLTILFTNWRSSPSWSGVAENKCNFHGHAWIPEHNLSSQIYFCRVQKKTRLYWFHFVRPTACPVLSLKIIVFFPFCLLHDIGHHVRVKTSVCLRAYNKMHPWILMVQDVYNIRHDEYFDLNWTVDFSICLRNTRFRLHWKGKHCQSYDIKCQNSVHCVDLMWLI